MTQEIGPQLQARVDEIRAALERGGDRFEPALTDRARRDLDRVLDRLALGVDHGVVALVGGTGSGKSSLFNALTTLDFADVGVIRPTTSQAAACVWGHTAGPLLDFLQVAPERRIQRESVLTGSDEADLRGLVLLDLPDHDSVATGHAELVNRLLPLIDLLIWVVDPQKYADNALHEGYLRELQDRHEAMLVVVNQVDTLTESGREAIHDDVRRLLAEDGLDDLPVMLASARTGEGIDGVRSHLREVLSTESMAARTARDEIAAVARRVADGLGSDEPAPPPPTQTAEAVADAAGIPAVVEALRAAVASPSPVAVSEVRRPARSRIDAIRESWLTTTTAGLPALWRTAIVDAISSASDFYDRATDALDGVAQPSPRDAGAARMRVLGLVALVLGVAVAIAGAVLLTQSTTLAIGVGAAGVVLMVLGLVLILLARRRRRRTATERADRYRRSILDAVATVARTDLVTPAEGVLADHRKVRQGVTGS